MAGIGDYLSQGFTDFSSAFSRHLAANTQDRPRFDRDLMRTALETSPGIGDAMSGGEALLAAKEGRYGDAAFGAAGMLPFLTAGSLRGLFQKLRGPQAEAITELAAEAPPGWKGTPARGPGGGELNYPLEDLTLRERPTKPPSTLDAWLRAEADRLSRKP